MDSISHSVAGYIYIYNSKNELKESFILLNFKFRVFLQSSVAIYKTIFLRLFWVKNLLGVSGGRSRIRFLEKFRDF